jgi:cellobiose phosphorylase
LYEHCRLAIEHGLRFGEHGLPLMGSCDWNDGMNLVGVEGKGESVWLGFFLCFVLTQFGELARRRNDDVFANRCSTEASRLGSAIEATAWDGAWYRRAWFDDGSPLGTASTSECRIDSVAQSWAVLSGVGDTGRSRQAMDALDRMLVNRDAALVRLLDPPFDHSHPSPGYIQGYVRGVRENGGQYTHAAVWAAMAFAAQGDSQRAWELFDMLNPIQHAKSAQAIDTYKAEPYVVAGDVYALPPHVGRGGWSWYTGSSGWMYRLILESLLGLQVEADILRLNPCLPSHWDGYTLSYRHRSTFYRIQVLPTAAVGATVSWTVDGLAIDGTSLHLIDDGAEHNVLVVVAKSGDLRCRSA